MVSKDKTRRVGNILNQGTHYATHYDFVVGGDSQASKSDSTGTSTQKPTRVYYKVDFEKSEAATESLKQTLERGYRLIIEAIPNVLNVNPESHVVKIEPARFQSQATLDHAWHKTADQLRLSINTFDLTYGKRAGAESKRRG